ncbi:hypothetical protein ACJVDH_06050 [Pedobacter sp. AW1-32]|uniref:hypothetical protein n=1 Tax=Pedobacter sp. AW1-32 TaxID=3383026 RepID=UPI003FF03379
MKTKILIALNLLLLMSCSSNSQDLSTVDFSNDGAAYLNNLDPSRKEEQKGHYEAVIHGEKADFKLIDNGERVINYLFIGQKSLGRINFAGLAIKENTGATMSVYQDKIAFMRLQLKNEDSFQLLDILKKKLGSPSEIISSKDNHYDANDKSQQLLLEKLPKETKKTKDDLLDEYYLSYPENFIWNRGEIIYQLTLIPSGNMVDNQLVIISKKAFKDKIIIGYHNPDQDPILKKYVK